MNRIITPGNKDRSVVPPEKQVDPAAAFQQTRKMLFIGSIMGMAEEADKYHSYNEKSDVFNNTNINGWPLSEEGAAEHLLYLLALCNRRKWNVARKALELHLARMEEAFKNEDKEKAPSGA